jgi:hypothetical protein
MKSQVYIKEEEEEEYRQIIEEDEYVKFDHIILSINIEERYIQIT